MPTYMLVPQAERFPPNSDLICRAICLSQQYMYMEYVSLNSTCIWSMSLSTVHVYGVCLSQLIRYYRACGFFHDFLDRGLLLARKLLNQWFIRVKLKSSLRKFYGRHHDLVNRYGISVSQMTTDMFHLS